MKDMMEKALGAPPSPSSAPIRQIQEPLKSPVRQRTRRWSTIAPIPEDSRAEVDQGPYSPRDQHHVDRVEDLNSASSSQSELDVLKKMTPITEDPPYHVFTLTQKRRLVYIVSLAALFSPLSSNIYFPALGAIATDLKISSGMANLTITTYMIMQGIAPSFWGPWSDCVGRRPVLIGTFLVFLVANIGLAFSDNITLLLVFRGIQAAGSAATISIGAGVIGDITTPKERGGLIGIFGGIRMLGQSIGPVFGGIITQYLGFRAIFWFLFILGCICVVLVLFLLPETLRAIAGNGTVRLTGFQRPLIHRFRAHTLYLAEPLPNDPPRKVTFHSMVAPLRFLFEKDVFISLFFGAVIYMVWSMMTSSTTTIFEERFQLNHLQAGLAFIPNGAGTVSGSYLTGYLMDHDYRVIERRYRLTQDIADDVPLDRKTAVGFPIEHSRLRSVWWIVLVNVIATALYGFSFGPDIMALPLILQFVIAYTATAVFSLNSALVIDLYPGAAASATAVNNLIRCSLGAGGVAVIDMMIRALGIANTFYVLAGVTSACAPLLLVEWRWGAKWRLQRVERLRLRDERKDLEHAEKLLHS